MKRIISLLESTNPTTEIYGAVIVKGKKYQNDEIAQLVGVDVGPRTRLGKKGWTWDGDQGEDESNIAIYDGNKNLGSFGNDNGGLPAALEYLSNMDTISEAPQTVSEAGGKPKFIKLTDYEQTDRILHANASVRIEHRDLEGHEVVVFIASSSASEDPFASDYDWRKAASAAMFGGSEEGAKIVGIWYTSAKVGSMCMDSEITDEWDYAELDPHCPYFK